MPDDPVLFAYDHRAAGHILMDHTSRTDHTVVSDGDTFQDHHMAAYPTMFAYRHGSGGIALLLDGKPSVFVAVIVVIHLHVFTEQGAVPYRDAGTGSQGTIVIEETIVTNFYPPPYGFSITKWKPAL